ncbi:unnamed protein product, partial [Amoebophrya sp. A25]|eukprot:GSA25T00022913001.1
MKARFLDEIERKLLKISNKNRLRVCFLHWFDWTATVRRKLAERSLSASLSSSPMSRRTRSARSSPHPHSPQGSSPVVSFSTARASRSWNQNHRSGRVFTSPGGASTTSGVSITGARSLQRTASTRNVLSKGGEFNSTRRRSGKNESARNSDFLKDLSSGGKNANASKSTSSLM